MRNVTRVMFGLGLLLLPSSALAQTPPQSCNTAGRTIALILDSSGSMNARLPNKETRIDVAKRAIKGVAALVPAQTQLSLRLYGAQSPSGAKNCQDTNLVVPFGAAAGAGNAIAASVDAAKAQGYTPIGFALAQAAQDFPADAKERVIVLVSDGKETCQGDPVVAAKSLAAKGVTIHTVGFIADTAARMQLQAIAAATGGTYFDAPLGPELPDSLKSALNACKKTVVTLPAKPKPGKLRTTAAGGQNNVFNAETGQRVDNLSIVRGEITLPAGVYEVQFGPARWKGVVIKPGETTTIAPAVLQIDNKEGGIELVDSETGERHASFDAVTNSVTVMPGVYDLKFRGKHSWPFIKLDGGKTTKLSLARVVLHRDLQWKSGRIVTAEGKVVWRFDAVTHAGSVPPGEYVIEIDDNKIPFTATQGDTLEIKPQ